MKNWLQETVDGREDFSGLGWLFFSIFFDLRIKCFILLKMETMIEREERIDREERMQRDIDYEFELEFNYTKDSLIDREVEYLQYRLEMYEKPDRNPKYDDVTYDNIVTVVHEKLDYIKLLRQGKVTIREGKRAEIIIVFKDPKDKKRFKGTLLFRRQRRDIYDYRCFFNNIHRLV